MQVNDQSAVGPEDVNDPPADELPTTKLFLEAVSRLREARSVLECWIRGGSMGKAVPAGSRIRIAFVDPRSYHAGQVVAFLTDGRICVHRIVYRGRWRASKESLITRGDRCMVPDFPVDVESVLGPVAEFSHEGAVWTSPGRPERRRAFVRLISSMADTFFAVLIEVDVKFAKRLLALARRIVRAVRARLRPRFGAFRRQRN